MSSATWCGAGRCGAFPAPCVADWPVRGVQGDGVALLVILHELFPEYTMPKYNATPKMEVHKVHCAATAAARARDVR